MTCQEAVDQLYEYLDAQLDNANAEQVQKHLDLCKLCCDHFEFEKQMKGLVHNSCVNQKAPSFLKDKILNSLKP